MIASCLILLGLSGCVAKEAPPWRPEAADLLFTSARDGDGEIYLRRAGAEEWTNLTDHDSSDNWPIWSSEGTRVVFQSRRTGNLDIWVMSADGSNPVQLTTDAEPDYLPAWSPDGETILFTSWRKEEGDLERAPHIYRMNPDGSDQRRLVATSLSTSEGAAWASDGKLIVFSRKVAENGADIFVADSDGKNERRITNDAEKGVYNGSPSFSPDGKLIAFYSDDGSAAALVIVGIDGAGRRTILAEGHNWYPRWSPDGRWIVYTASVESGDKGNVDIFAVPVAGDGQPTLLVGSDKRDLEASWRR
ncbi:MAG: hypothetical protein ACKVU1_16820 [bacterium]